MHVLTGFGCGLSDEFETFSLWAISKHDVSEDWKDDTLHFVGLWPGFEIENPGLEYEMFSGLQVFQFSTHPFDQ